MGDVVNPLRVATTGQGVGPGLYDCLFILGRETCRARIAQTLAMLKPEPRSDRVRAEASPGRLSRPTPAPDDRLPRPSRPSPEDRHDAHLRHRFDRLRLHHGLPGTVPGPHPPRQDARPERLVPGRFAEAAGGAGRRPTSPTTSPSWASGRWSSAPSEKTSPSIASGSTARASTPSAIKVIADEHTASCFINTDLQDNQITAFYPGAMAQASTISLHDLSAGPDDLVIIAPNDPKAITRYTAECTAAGIPYLYDPSMQLPRMDRAELEDGCKGAKILAGNDYEFGMMAEKMGLAEAELRRRTPDHGHDPRRGRRPDHGRRPGIRDPPGQAREGRRPHRRGRRLPRGLRDGDEQGLLLADGRPACRLDGGLRHRASRNPGALLHDRRVHRPVQGELRRPRTRSSSLRSAGHRRHEGELARRGIADFSVRGPSARARSCLCSVSVPSRSSRLPTWRSRKGCWPSAAISRPERLLAAYRQGIFPWYEPGGPILWWSPDPRLVLFPDELKISRRLARTIRQGRFETRYNTAFAQVIRACAEISRAHEDGTWITPEMQRAYIRLHELGHAHCMESWREGRLVGGIYGVRVGRCFCGESMFHHETDASKVALAALVDRLRGRGRRADRLPGRQRAPAPPGGSRDLPGDVPPPPQVGTEVPPDRATARAGRGSDRLETATSLD